MNSVFLYLLVIYTITISCLPCQDDVFQSWKDKTDIQMTAINSLGLENENRSLDLCSPFCTCTCCSVPTSTAPSTELPVLLHKKIESIQAFTYTSTFLSFDFASIWQPPKNTV